MLGSPQWFQPSTSKVGGGRWRAACPRRRAFESGLARNAPRFQVEWNYLLDKASHQG